LKNVLETIIIEKRVEIKKIKENYGKRVLGEVTLDDCLEGGRRSPVIFSQHSMKAKIPSFLETFYNTAAQQEHHSLYLYESFLWYLFTQRHATSSELEEFLGNLSERRTNFRHYSHLSLLSKLPTTTFSHTYLLSMCFLTLQPYSTFFHHRKETKKPDLWKPILDDVLDIIAILPELLRHINKLSKDPSVKFSLEDKATQGTIGNGHKHSSYLSRLDGIPNSFSPTALSTSSSSAPNRPAIPRFVHNNKDSWTLKFIENTLQDGGENPLVHTMRLVNCTLSDPYLAISAAISAYHDDTLAPELYHKEERNHDNSEKSELSQSPRGNIFEDGHYYHLTAELIGSLIELFWDRALLFPLENPKSVDIPFLIKYFEESKQLSNDSKK
jgi:hypothetical protein